MSRDHVRDRVLDFMHFHDRQHADQGDGAHGVKGLRRGEIAPGQRGLPVRASVARQLGEMEAGDAG